MHLRKWSVIGENNILFPLGLKKNVNYLGDCILFSKDGREALGYFIQTSFFLFTCMTILSLRPKLQGFVVIGGMNIILCYVRKGTNAGSCQEGLFL